VSEVVVLRWPRYVGCCGGSNPLLGDQVGAWLCCWKMLKNVVCFDKTDKKLVEVLWFQRSVKEGINMCVCVRVCSAAGFIYLYSLSMKMQGTS